MQPPNRSYTWGGRRGGGPRICASLAGTSVERTTPWLPPVAQVVTAQQYTWGNAQREAGSKRQPLLEPANKRLRGWGPLDSDRAFSDVAGAASIETAGIGGNATEMGGEEGGVVEGVEDKRGGIERRLQVPCNRPMASRMRSE